MENCRDRWCWSEASTFTANRGAASNAAREGDDFAAAHSTRGGLRDTEVKEFAVIPDGGTGRVGGRDHGDARGVLAQRPAQLAHVEPRRLRTPLLDQERLCGASASNHQGANSRASSNPAAIRCATAGCRVAASTTARWWGSAGRSQEFVHSVAHWAHPRQKLSKVRSIHPASNGPRWAVIASR